MFYFFAVPLMVYNYILVLAAVIPAIALLIWTYKADRLEKESPRLFFTEYIQTGALCQRGGSSLSDASLPGDTPVPGSSRAPLNTP